MGNKKGEIKKLRTYKRCRGNSKNCKRFHKKENTNIFLDINPMSSYKGKILRSTYEPELSPEEVLSYKLISSFEGSKDIPRIGLRGTAKVYGNRTILFYYLFRKPITFIRQLIGI